MVIAPLIVRPLLEMLNTPSTIIDWCASYLKISMYGIAGLAYYNILSGILRGMGDSFSALLYLLVATVLNIGLDILFVAQFNMGVGGVALATAIAQAISSVLCLKRLMNMRNVFDLDKQHLKMKSKYVKQIVALGLPSGVTQAIFSSAMIIVQSLTNSLGKCLLQQT